MWLEKIGLIAANHFTRPREFKASIVFRTGKPVFRINAFLKRINPFKLFRRNLDNPGLLIKHRLIKRVHQRAGQKISPWNDDMNMRLALHQLACFPVGVAAYFRNVRFSVKIIFIRIVSTHGELLKVLHNGLHYILV
ncbi:MAG: hypothetical protein CVU36_24290 [Betaproteobacteria bacterium HGW-Betaproteobacteria-9]|nr:MAG: hypothetical protein CVV12_11120 [Gammaproteobacteria bacterium HGW-Gammaproteobacteria-2]PKO26448.1 MAG: hypothetical protein CVU36_24290 [Betaproteobacteria bacterium HGW-Betaproteobacteria-9]